ncbi:MAG: protein translocase subunit SecD [Pelagibacterales bacterium]|nr:protein translocase subunit SecD [Pelagibacterales bacterium]
MLIFENWKRILVLVVSTFAIIFSLPNFLSKDLVNNSLSFIKSGEIRLGLDLQGGSYLLLRVESESLQTDRLNSLSDELRLAMRSASPRIGYKNLKVSGTELIFTLVNNEEESRVKGLIDSIDKELIFNKDSYNNIILSMSEDKIKEIRDYAILQSIEIIRRRVDEVGTNEPLIQRQGDERILVQLPGLDDPERIKKLLGKTARMNFRLVNETASIEESLSGRVPPGSDLLFEIDERTGEKSIPYVIYKRIGVSGDQLVDANPTMDQNNQPVVSLRFDTSGSRKFGELTSKNVGKRFAIVLDGEVISAPVIREAITGGSGQISGNFTFESASDLSVLLRAGALPAPLTILEERSVGPSLGKDSINAGMYAALISIILVIIYMVIIYGTRFGVAANISLMVNILLIIALLGVLDATLTLPGLAGIALTVGMAVDANVLIFERIREESRSGRSDIGAIDNGFKEAFRTIVDANITTLLAALILFQFGSGPVKGFAVTLALGVITTMFSSLLLSRGIITFWYNKFKPTSLNI